MIKGIFYNIFLQKKKKYTEENFEEYEYLNGDVIEYGTENKKLPNPNEFYL
ncbi:hypothetical protein [Niallia taxi]|uniref:hypothetical protein n=1 Tax=Niallia taxi TaxID=2499688 RepID=UPI003D2BFD00